RLCLLRLRSLFRLMICGICYHVLIRCMILRLFNYRRFRCFFHWCFSLWLCFRFPVFNQDRLLGVSFRTIPFCQSDLSSDSLSVIHEKLSHARSRSCLEQYALRAAQRTLYGFRSLLSGFYRRLAGPDITFYFDGTHTAALC